MELGLQMQKISCYQARSPVMEAYEEIAENIIPDYCPDISRIIDASACVFVRKYERADNRIIVHGTTKVNVLYMAEGGTGIKSFEFSLPLEHTLELHLEEQYSKLSLTAGITSLEVRPLNPRKLLTRASIAFALKAFCPQEYTLCVSIPDRQKYGIEVLKEEKNLSYIKSICEKDFVFNEEIVLSAAKEPIMELLRCSQSLRLDESKVLGSKVMLKGCVQADILYLSEKGTIQQLSSELPFSQILDGCEGEAGLLSARTTLELSDAECRMTDENRKVISVKYFIRAFTELFESKQSACICDLYSTSHRIEPSFEEFSLSEYPSASMYELSGKEVLEVGTEISSVLAVDVMPNTVSCAADWKNGSLHMPCTVKILYISDLGVPYCAERRCEIKSEFPAGYTLNTAALQVQKLTATPIGNGIDVRFVLSGALEADEQSKSIYLAALEVFDAEPEEQKTPSIILRRKQGDESLWATAKACRTTVDEILAANECTEEHQIKDGQMLLIPKKR